MIYTVEVQYLLPVFKTVHVEAESEEEARSLARANEDWDDAKFDYDNARETEITGLVEGKYDMVYDSPEYDEKYGYGARGLSEDSMKVAEPAAQPRRIIARLHVQVWVRDHAVELEEYDIDVTDKILAMSPVERAGLENNRYTSDELARDKLAELGHNGPFWVEVEDAIEQYFESAQCGGDASEEEN